LICLCAACPIYHRHHRRRNHSLVYDAFAALLFPRHCSFSSQILISRKRPTEAQGRARKWSNVEKLPEGVTWNMMFGGLFLLGLLAISTTTTGTFTFSLRGSTLPFPPKTPLFFLRGNMKRPGPASGRAAGVVSPKVERANLQILRQMQPRCAQGSRQAWRRGTLDRCRAQVPPIQPSLWSRLSTPLPPLSALPYLFPTRVLTPAL
jgi:hypothetical protein